MAQTVFVGLSGGVDSAVSAALLKDQGYSVVGVFIKIWQPEFLECTWERDRLDAMRSAATLGIGFREIDLSKEYQTGVVAEMIASYMRGETPNPDVDCNRTIKFGTFARWARENGADLIATGHYARIRQEFGTAELLRGKDAKKDQSYFLFRLDKNDLLKTLFPVGNMTKDQVRRLARKYGLPVANKHDSQGLCFVGDVSMRDFLRRFISVEEGPVVDIDGNTIGVHEGAALYTLGQRHGFVVTHGTSGTPLYVTEIHINTNTIRVSHNRSDAASKQVKVRDTHWVGKFPTLPVSLNAQARYREGAVAVEVSREGENVFVTFNDPHIASPGQSIVFYDGDVCLGGATIDSRVHDATVHSFEKKKLEKVQ